MIPPSDSDLDEFGLGYAERSTEPSRATGKGLPVEPIRADSAMSPHSLGHGISWSDCPPVKVTDIAETLAQLRKHAPINAPQSGSAQIGLGPVDIAPGATITVRARTYTSFKPTKCIVNESIPGSTRMDNIFIGNRNVFPGADGIFASGLGSHLGGGVSWPTAHAGIDIAFEISNVSKVAVKWSAVLVGHDLR